MYCQPKLIAICGFKRCGKDTVARYLLQKYPYAKHVKIAEPLKMVCKILFGFSDEQLESNVKDEVDNRWGVSPRKVMQFLGTEVFQHKIQEILPCVKKELFIRALKLDPKTRHPYIISDLRFMHEYEYIKHVFTGKNDVCIVKIMRDQQDHAADMHSSELEWTLIPSDCTLTNNGTIDDLYNKLDTLVYELNQMQ